MRGRSWRRALLAGLLRSGEETGNITPGVSWPTSAKPTFALAALHRVAKGGMVKRGKREGRRRQGRQVLQLAVHGDAALRHAALPSCRASTSQGRPHGEVRQEGTKVGVAKGGMRKCGKSEGRLGQGRLVGVPEFGARIRDFGEIHSPQITGCKCPLGIPTPPITKVRTKSGRR